MWLKIYIIVFFGYHILIHDMICNWSSFSYIYIHKIGLHDHCIYIVYKKIIICHRLQSINLNLCCSHYANSILVKCLDGWISIDTAQWFLLLPIWLLPFFFVFKRFVKVHEGRSQMCCDITKKRKHSLIFVKDRFACGRSPKNP